MVVHEHEIDFGIIDTYFVRTNPVIDFFEHMVNCFFSKISCFFPEICRWISSAYKTVLQLEAFTISLIYTRNSKGPTTNPWGTTHVTFKKEDLVSPILVH